VTNSSTKTDRIVRSVTTNHGGRSRNRGALTLSP
jgi:hypothetical protein